MKQNDGLIGECLKKMHQAEVLEGEEQMERADTDTEEHARDVIHQTIQETIGGFVHSLNVIEIESKELAAKTNEIKRRVEIAKRP